MDTGFFVALAIAIVLGAFVVLFVWRHGSVPALVIGGLVLVTIFFILLMIFPLFGWTSYRLRGEGCPDGQACVPAGTATAVAAYMSAVQIGTTTPPTPTVVLPTATPVPPTVTTIVPTYTPAATGFSLSLCAPQNAQSDWLDLRASAAAKQCVYYGQTPTVTVATIATPVAPKPTAPVATAIPATTQAIKPVEIIHIGKNTWEGEQAVLPVTPAGADELYVAHGDVLGTGSCNVMAWGPGQTVSGLSAATWQLYLIQGGTPEQRLKQATLMQEAAARQTGSCPLVRQP